MSNGSNKILRGHKRLRKKFIPPLLQLPGIRETSYINQLLPDILWLGLINDAVGYSRGIALALSLASFAHKKHEEEKFLNFALSSSFSSLREQERREIREQLARGSDLHLLQTCLAPIIFLFPNCPLSFLGSAEDLPKKQDLISRLKSCIKRHFDKHDLPGLIVQAEVMYIRGMLGGLFFSHETTAPDINALIDEPTSDKAQEASAKVRSFAISEILLADSRDASYWPKIFWNESFKIDECE